jgi:hypothetical protein
VLVPWYGAHIPGRNATSARTSGASPKVLSRYSRSSASAGSGSSQVALVEARVTRVQDAAKVALSKACRVLDMPLSAFCYMQLSR